MSKPGSDVVELGVVLVGTGAELEAEAGAGAELEAGAGAELGAGVGLDIRFFYVEEGE